MSTQVTEQVKKVDVRKAPPACRSGLIQFILEDSKKDAEEYVKSYDVGRGAE